MHGEVERLLGQYERGRLSRRELLGALAALVATGSAPGAEAEPAIGAVRALNHVTVFVRDVASSVAFYQRLFGMPVLTPQTPGMNLDTGTGFLGIYPAPAGRTGWIDHLCLALERFDADSVSTQLSAHGVKSNIRLRSDTKELYFTDPDGIRVQLQDVRYRGGTGPLGDRDPA